MSQLINSNSWKRIITYVAIFSIAMAMLESAVVIYLREIYFDGGFGAPLPPMQDHIFITELLRELATLIMLICIGLLAGHTCREKFAYFLISFAVWDIFYYIFLKILIDWPDSLVEWDILFLLPVPWTGPVMAPVIIAINMIMFGIILIQSDYSINKYVIISMLIGCSIVLFTFTSGHWHYLSAPWETNSNGLIELNFQGFPTNYNWLLFTLGEIFILLPLLFLSLLLSKYNYER